MNTSQSRRSHTVAVATAEHLSQRKRQGGHLLQLLLVMAVIWWVALPAKAAQSTEPSATQCDSIGDAGSAYVPGVNCRTIEVDGYTRHYLVWVPPTGVPIGTATVIMLHGGSGSGGEFLSRSGWREKATQEGFVAVFPTAVEHFILEKQRFATHWNEYGTLPKIDPNKRPSGYPETAPWPADDVKFVREIASDVHTQLATDERRVYVAGFSNGASMCARLGVEASDLIAAVACHAGGLNEIHETLNGHRNLSAYLSVGTRDDRVLEPINEYLTALGQPTLVELPLDAVRLNRIPHFKSFLLSNLDSLNVASAPVAVVNAPNTTEFRFQSAQPGNADGNEFVFTVLDDVKHEYPNGQNNPLGFDLPDAVWPFFVQHPKP